jgi:hypothetical protein
MIGVLVSWNYESASWNSNFKISFPWEATFRQRRFQGHPFSRWDRLTKSVTY